MSEKSTLFQKAERLQDILVAYSTGGPADDQEYTQLRRELLGESTLTDSLPSFVHRFRHIREFWPFISGKFPTYRERRQYLWEEFAPILDMLERRSEPPSTVSVSQALQALDAETVHKAWQRALHRLSLDEPDAAITSARTLLETVCKHILDDLEIRYQSNTDLPHLLRLTLGALQVAPSQQTEGIVRQIMGGCVAVVEGVGALRNKLGDAHGTGKLQPKPEIRHGELAVNLAGAVATFLVETWRGSKRVAPEPLTPATELPPF